MNLDIYTNKSKEAIQSAQQPLSFSLREPRYGLVNRAGVLSFQGVPRQQGQIFRKHVLYPFNVAYSFSFSFAYAL